MNYEILSAPDALVNFTQAKRYFVELASHASELDAYGVEVPSDYKTLDVVVTEPTNDAIEVLLRAAGHLEDYSIVRRWVPEDCDCF